MRTMAGLTSMIVLLTLAGTVLGQADTVPTAELESPIDLGQTATIETSGGRLHANGTALGGQFTWSLEEATIKVFRQRQGPCAQDNPQSCAPGDGFNNAQQTPYELEDVEITVRTAQDSRIAIIAGATSSTDMEGSNAVLRVPTRDSRVAPPQGGAQLSEYSDTIEAGSAVLTSERGAWSLIGNVQLIPNDALITFQGTNTETGQSMDRQVQTGWTWSQESGVYYRDLYLVRVSGRGPVPITWSAPVDIAPSLPFNMASDRLESAAGTGTLPDGSRVAGAGVALSDVQTEVRGVIMPSEGPARLQVAFTEAAAPPPPTDTPNDDASLVKVGGTAAVTAAAVAGAAWYWPRLRWGAAVLALPMYSRIQKSELLEHDVREQLYNVIKTEPGIHAHALASEANLGWGTTVYHLRLLEKNRLVTSERHGRFRRFYPAAGYLQGKKEVLAVLQNETSNDVARYILKNPGHNQSAMCEALDISPSLANWHVKRLVKAELVRKERQGRSVHYYPGPAWEELSDLPDHVELMGAGGKANA